MLAIIPLCVLAFWAYTVLQIEAAKRQGIYPSPEDGIRAVIARGWKDVEKIEINHAGTNSFNGSNPHIGFASATVRAASRMDGSPMGAGGYDFPGSYFLRVDTGWVYVSEGAFPEVIGCGMRLFQLYGCSRAAHNCE